MLSQHQYRWFMVGSRSMTIQLELIARNGVVKHVIIRSAPLFKALDQWFEAARFGADVQQVMTLRMMRIASGGPGAATEAQQMVSEKLAAFGESQVALMTALATGRSFDSAAKLAYAPYRGGGRAQKRKLGS
jgi:hypothetical protein